MRRLRLRTKKLTAIIICAAVLVINCCPDVYALSDNSVKTVETERSDIIEIRNIEDFRELARKSVDEACTRGKKISLLADLDFEDIEYIPISVMAGNFEGNGHKITGIEITKAGSEGGFIRKITADGIVGNLTVSAEIIGNNDSENIGGIAGINDGKIINVSFEGKIISYRASGGIAGYQSSSGNIINCENTAQIISQRRSGGIVGFNEGNVESSVNKGGVNDSAKTASEILNEDDDSQVEIKAEDKRILCSGGIAGLNTGIIEKCENKGTVGIRSIAYLTGGICGYNRGYIGQSENNGAVFSRKNTGGITGLFEPYTMRVYEDDSFDRAGDELDELNDLLTELHGLTGSEDDKIQTEIDSIRAETDALRFKISENKAYYRNKDDIIEGQLQSRLDAIRSTAEDMDDDFKIEFSTDTSVSVKEKADETAELIAALIAAIMQGAYVSIPDSLTKISSNANDIAKAMNNSISQLKAAGKKISKKTAKLIDSLEELRDEMTELDDYGRDTADSYKCDLRNTSDDMSERIENIASGMDSLNEAVKNSDAEIRKKSDEIAEKSRQIKESAEDGFDEAKDLIEDIKDTDSIKDIYEDISDDENTTVSSGFIVNCKNNANIYGDINSGGIAGTIDYWLETESEMKTVTAGSPSLKYHLTQRAGIIDCENYGDILGDKNYSGGIVGRAENGAIIASGNYANLVSKKGDYCGGIAGYALTVRDCYSVASVSANAESGGIVGKGKNICNNKAIVSIYSEKEHCGAIAGSLEENGKVSGNEFVSDDVKAVNGATNSKEAKEKSYDEITSGDVPAAFKELTVTFVNEGEVIKRVAASYNGTIDKKDIPPLPKRKGYVSYWSTDKFDPVRSSMVVETLYKAYITTIASSGKEPRYIMEGEFYPDSSLTVEEVEETGTENLTLDKNYKKISKLKLTVSSDYGILTGNHTIRLLDENKKDSIAIRSGKSLKLLPTSRDGKYLVADIAGRNTVYIVRKKTLLG